VTALTGLAGELGFTEAERACSANSVPEGGPAHGASGDAISVRNICQ